MLKSFTYKSLVAVLFLAVFSVSSFLVVNTNDTGKVTFSFGQTVEAKWYDEIRDDIRDEIRRESRRDYNRWKKEQRNIHRADGDARFADRYLSDAQVSALRALKQLPCGYEITLEATNREISAIRSICKQLPEFAFVGYAEDTYGERLGCIVYRSKVVY